jgi:hypothetical protein
MAFSGFASASYVTDKGSKITLEVKDDLKIYVPKNILRAIDVKKGDG